MVDKTNPVPLYLQVKQAIEKNIINQSYPPGSQIPTEKILMDTYQVGRATIRMALSELVHEGKITKKHGIGTFVSHAPTALAFEPLISLSYSLKSMGIVNTNEILLNKTLIVTKSLAKEARLKSLQSLQHILRIRYADSLPLVLENSYLHPELYQRIQHHDLSESLAELLLHTAHLTISKIDQSIKFRFPTKNEQAYLHITPTTSVVELTRWLYTDQYSDPIYYLHFTMLSHVLNYPFNQFSK